MIVCIVLILLAIIWTVQYRYRRRKMYELASKISHPKDELPFIGVAHKFIGNTEVTMTSMKQFSYEAMESGITRVWLNHILYFVMVNPADLEKVLRTCLEKDNLHKLMRKFLGNGGIFAPVPIWRRRRKILMPAFNSKIVEGFLDIFLEQSQIVTKKLASLCGPEAVNLWPTVFAYSLDAISESTMGVKYTQTDANSEFLNFSESLNIVSQRVFHLWLRPDWLFRFFPQYTKYKKCLQVIHERSDEKIQWVTLYLLKKCQEFLFSGDPKRKSFLELLIKLSGGDKGYGNLELREEMMSIFIAGTDTSAVTIGFTLILLGKYPDIQQKVYEEIQEVFGDSDRPLVKGDLLKLKYLERVVKESLRLFPPLPFINRRVERDIILPSGVTIPSGSGIFVSIFGAHRDPKYWGPDAEHFDPDRFLPERYNLQHACSYMPFSYGPRNCVGSQFAFMSIKTVLSSILRNFKIIGEPETGSIPNIRLKLDFTLKAAEGYYVKLEKRKTCHLQSQQN
ncbi:cytochrome P450 4C1-like [Bicyclus anynana]|uniref:Cytochrome P450 4C1-like n=1 Tax=Bicyclus anynana TaxID=110368 RepID=A0ABM3LHT1_BICAN|nr:cytochrome P450 4C1-like [Bicyclus anynana]